METSIPKYALRGAGNSQHMGDTATYTSSAAIPVSTNVVTSSSSGSQCFDVGSLMNTGSR